MSANDSTRHFGPAVLGFVLFVVAGVLAMSVDVPRTTYGIKSDESTYVAATLSAAALLSSSRESQDSGGTSSAVMTKRP